MITYLVAALAGIVLAVLIIFIWVIIHGLLNP